MSKALEDAVFANDLGPHSVAEYERKRSQVYDAAFRNNRVDAAVATAETMGKIAADAMYTVTEYAPVGIKHDDGKPAMHLIPPEAVEALAQVLAFGANKYEPRNWERGLLYSRVFSAATRHLWAWWRGEDTDPETGFSHLDHALTCVAFLVAYERRTMGSFDDRPKSGV